MSKVSTHYITTVLTGTNTVVDTKPMSKADSKQMQSIIAAKDPQVMCMYIVHYGKKYYPNNTGDNTEFQVSNCKPFKFDNTDIISTKVDYVSINEVTTH